MKVIFLDVDGVLQADDDFGGKNKPNPYVGGFRGISKAKVKQLKRIVDATDAKIVLVSTWKHEYMDYLRTKDNQFGKYLVNKLSAEHLHIYETTYMYDRTRGGMYRGFEIRSWLNDTKENIESWIVIDDEIFYDYAENKILSHLVHTDEKTGLTSELADKAIEILNKGVETNIE